MMQAAYQLVQPLLFKWDPETAHERVLGLVQTFPKLSRGMSGADPAPARLRRTVAGVDLHGPVGLAAGLDKEAKALPIWEHLGFGFVEIGTVTPRPQLGNPRPRIHRFPERSALVNSMGFPSEGMEVLADRLAHWKQRGLWPSIPVGINLGKNKDTPADSAHEDYATLTRRLREHASWFTVNVSSPNTPGLRALQHGAALQRILEATLEEAGSVPVFVKFAPDMADEELAQTTRDAITAGIAGIVATNTTRERFDVPVPEGMPGGLSGEPLFDHALHKVKVVVEAAEGRVPVMGVGGIDRPMRAKAYLDLGCEAVQLYTGLIFRGPGLIQEINAAL